MRRSIATVGAILLGLSIVIPGAASPSGAAPPDPGLSPADRASLAAGIPVAPKAALGAKPTGPNPYLAMVPDAARVDYSGWNHYLQRRSPAQAVARLKAPGAVRPSGSTLVIDEDEPDGTRGANESPATAQRITRFGTAPKKNPRIRILGSLNPEQVIPDTVAANAEDDGAIPLAGNTGIGTAGRKGIETSARIGDGPHGSAGTGTNDFDFYRLTSTPGKVITIATDTPTGDLDTVVAVFDPAGHVLAANDDFGGSLDSRLEYKVPATGTFYAMVAGYNGLPADPFDPASGDGDGSEGPYTVRITSGDDDSDFFAVKLRAGDVLGASAKGANTYLTLFDTTPREVHGSQQNASFIYPMASPLPGGGNQVTDYVATKAGWHYVGVTGGSGGYAVTVEGYRAVLERVRPIQTLFLDFDGERVNTGVFGGTGNVDLSPLAAFLGKWGLTRADERRLIDVVTATVTENLRKDLTARGLNKRFKLKLVTSKNGADPWGGRNVSRIVVGGTIAESGVPTIGIAQSIDPGNFETEETALVLLDVLSDPAGDDASLNTYLRPASNRVAFVGRALGNVISHEAGHFFGNWHTDNSDASPNLQDAGGANFGVLFGVGPDGVGGTADDRDVDFGDDRFSPTEGFVGTEDTLGRIDFGVTS
ncbi:pre-peptidase C-terminal domain-containing protein [Krasilnikovia sp. M28-CT-15]|uniref:pre-peptidase C-terminal domain-containing protein n=1 Tax=Krasilnikovia sp. M28-CT-15 TaxID=3373540 RepID=UPI003876A816